MSPEAKRQRKICATFHLFLEHAREIWGRDKEIASSTQIEDREFREMFGCGVGVAVYSWEKLVEKNLVPDKGSSRHLLYTLVFLKVYGKEYTMCKLAWSERCQDISLLGLAYYPCDRGARIVSGKI